jgi:hypothetical protein
MIYTCRICKNDNLLADEVIFNGSNIAPMCKKCWNIKSRKYYNEHRDKIKARSRITSRVYTFKRKYGITIEEYDEQVKLQLGGCAICKQPCKSGNNLCIDHNHKTNQVRNLLCNRCNKVLGLVGEDEDLLWNILEYLKKWEQKSA